MKILLMDNDKLTIERLTEYLQAEGHYVVGCKEDKQAIQEWQKNRGCFDLVIFECSNMNGVGVDLMRFLQRHGNGIRAMILTSAHPGNLKKEYGELENVPILAKPFNWRQFESSLGQVLSRKRRVGILLPAREDGKRKPFSARHFRQ